MPFPRKRFPTPDPEPRTFSSNEVSDIANVSLRQLQWWDERRVVMPRHEGHRRVYYRTEVIEIAVIAELRRKGFSLQKIRRVLLFLQKYLSRRLDESLAADADLHLLLMGRDAVLESDPDRLVRILKGTTEPSFVVCVTDEARRIEKA